MQHIGIEIDNETFSKEKSSENNFAKVLGYVWENTQKEDYPWIWGIDAYGLTVFNIQQTPNLVNELSKLKDKVQEEDIKADIQSLIDFITENMEQHLYLKFIGD
ncbi:MAG: hypothetical protein IT410_04020 [Candidatus Doudnabacteria bacterium]|nr:hypothetical protein [Candidatus Doudnabacteria bacterium]